MDRRRALAVLRRAFARAPRATRLHVAFRFLTCPMLRVLDHVPPGSALLDLGAGHGSFGLLARAAGRASRVVALEPDARKLVGVPVAGPAGFARVAGFAPAVRGEFGCVSVLDVLYRLPVEAWDGFLLEARSRLADGGVLLLKEIDPGHRMKGAWNRAQERGADLLGLTLGDAFAYEAPIRLAERLARLGFESIEIVDLGAGYPHAHVLLRAVWRGGADAGAAAIESTRVAARPGDRRRDDGRC